MMPKAGTPAPLSPRAARPQRAPARGVFFDAKVCKDVPTDTKSTIVWTLLHGGRAMAERDLGDTDPAAHQPTKPDMEEDVNIDASPEALAWAVTRGGAERREKDVVDR